MIRAVVALLALCASTSTAAREPLGLDALLAGLERSGAFSGAVVVRDGRGTRFAKGYGLADPFTGRHFTPDTPVDSGSLAKPVTAAAVLQLARDGRLDLDSAATRYLPELGTAGITVRHLLSHSAGLHFEDSAQGLAGKSNLELVRAARGRPLSFKPGTAFSYCNLCTIALAEIVERASGRSYLETARTRLGLPSGVTLRPARLADWEGRAIGYRPTATGKFERFDSWEGEAFYGAANLSITARQLAQWGSRWWQAPLAPIRAAATAPGVIDGKVSGLTMGNWYCAASRRRCHYLGHHEGFHHMLYWDVDRRLSIAMVSNNALAPALQQRLQRAVVAAAEDRVATARREIVAPMRERDVAAGSFRLPDGELLTISRTARTVAINRRGIAYPAYPMSAGIRYLPGLDAYVSARADGSLHWLTLYEDALARRD